MCIVFNVIDSYIWYIASFCEIVCTCWALAHDLHSCCRKVLTMHDGMSSLLWAVREVWLWGNTATLMVFPLIVIWRVCYDWNYLQNNLTRFNSWLCLVCKTYKFNKFDNLLTTFIYEVCLWKWGLRKKKRLWCDDPVYQWLIYRKIKLGSWIIKVNFFFFWKQH